LKTPREHEAAEALFDLVALGRNRTTDTRFFKTGEWTPTMHMNVHSQARLPLAASAAELSAEIWRPWASMIRRRILLCELYLG
jgi:hypothetical protein